MSVKTATLYEPGYIVAGKYELESLLGQGGMGAVWRARNIALDAPVAIKVVRATSARAGGDKALLHGRLMQEARAAAKLTHPAIVKMFDVGQTQTGDPFIVMELLQGDSLGKIIEKGRLSAVQAVRTLLPIADALWLAHGKGIVHRDLKPDNIFIVQHEGSIQPTLVDFGIVKVQEADGDSHLTKAGDVLGSPDYMSPEQARGQDDVSHLTDIWSFAVVLYETISGRTPFKGSNYNALLRQIVEDTPPSLQELSAGDAQLSAIVARGLSKQPDQRFASMGELGRALAKWLVSHGVAEDICGTTLEAKWLRGTDSQGRAGRATFASISDAWQAESVSGVRNLEGGIHTLPAPARSTGAVEAGPRVDEAEPNRGPKWLIPAGLVGAMLLALGWFVLTKPNPAPAGGASIERAAAAARSEAAPGVAASAPAPSAPEVAPSAAAATTSVSNGETAAQPPPEPVSSKVGRMPATAAAHGKRPVPKSHPKGGGSSGTAKSKPGDLLSPY